MKLTKMQSIATNLSPAFKCFTSLPVSTTSTATSATVVPNKQLSLKSNRDSRFSTPQVPEGIRRYTIRNKSRYRITHHTLDKKANNERLGNSLSNCKEPFPQQISF